MSFRLTVTVTQKPAVSIRNVSKSFRLYHEKNQYLKTALLRGRRAQYEEFAALTDVSFDIPHGTTFGIIGSNGSGKSTLLKCLTGILTPESGSVKVNGNIAALLELGSGFHPDLSGRENVFLNGAILGMSQKELEEKFDDIVEFAGLEHFIDTPVKNYSSGMTVRLGFAIAINVNPEILIIDEILAVGDDEFQLKCYEKIDQFRSAGKTIILVSHGLGDVQRICDTVAWINKGKLKMLGDPAEVVPEYLSASRSGATGVVEGHGQRWGSGEVTIDEVSFLDSEQIPTGTLHTGDPATIQIRMTSTINVPTCVIGLSVSALHHEGIWSSNSKLHNIEIPLVAGANSVEIDIASLPFLDGMFDLTVAVADSSGTHEYDHWDKRVKFNVHQRRIVDSGLVSVDCTWRTTST